MLKTLHAGLGAYRETQQTVKEMKGKQGGTASEGDIDLSLPAGPCPENLSFLIPRLRSRDPKFRDPGLWSVSIREMIGKAGGPGPVIQASRAQADEFRRSLREVSTNDGLAPDKRRDLIDMYKDSIMANEVSARVVECYARQGGVKGAPPRQQYEPYKGKGYEGNPYSIEINPNQGPTMDDLCKKYPKLGCK